MVIFKLYFVLNYLNRVMLGRYVLLVSMGDERRKDVLSVCEMNILFSEEGSRSIVYFYLTFNLNFQKNIFGKLQKKHYC